MKRFYSELAYLVGLAALALGTALMEAADFGVSMVVAPAYVLYRRLSLWLPWFTFGMAEYLTQGVVLLLLVAVMRKFPLRYLWAFATAVLYGLLLDGALALVSLLPPGGIPLRISLYLLGMVVCAAGVSLLFHTHIAPEVYELFVREVAGKLDCPPHRCKFWYDCASCALGVVLSFLCFGFGRFEGVKWGTVVCALVNGTMIGWFSRFFEGRFTFVRRF